MTQASPVMLLLNFLFNLTEARKSRAESVKELKRESSEEGGKNYTCTCIWKLKMQFFNL